MRIEPIADYCGPLPTKFGVPRQSGLAAGLPGEIVFRPEFRSPDAVRGLEGFDRIWLIWEFSDNPDAKTFQATVRPPRLGWAETPRWVSLPPAPLSGPTGWGFRAWNWCASTRKVPSSTSKAPT